MKRHKPLATFQTEPLHRMPGSTIGHNRRARSNTQEAGCRCRSQTRKLQLFRKLPIKDVGGNEDRSHTPVPAPQSSSPPPRSVLYNLAPRPGESLTSYLAYVAVEYVVQPRAVVSVVIKPFLGRIATVEQPYSFECTFFSRTHALNGMDAAAANLARALDSLTGRDDLRGCTMLPFAGLLSDIGLMRRHRAWCLACLHESQGEEYEKRLWTLAAVNACPRHGLLLHTRCPHCARELPVLSSNSRPGYCPRCDGRLDAAEPSRASEQDLWVSRTIDDLLVRTRDTVLRPEKLVGAVDRYVAEMFGGNRTHAARAIGVSPGTIFSWQHGTAVPTLDALLRICRLWRISLFDFFENAFRCGADKIPDHESPQARSGRRERFDAESVEERLRAALEEEPARSMPAVALRIDRPEHRLRYYYPDLCKQISARFIEDRKARSAAKKKAARSRVIRAVYEIHAQGEYPSQRKVSLLLPPGEFMNRDVAAAWRETVRKLGLRPPRGAQDTSDAGSVPPTGWNRKLAA